MTEPYVERRIAGLERMEERIEALVRHQSVIENTIATWPKTFLDYLRDTRADYREDIAEIKKDQKDRDARFMNFIYALAGGIILALIATILKGHT